MKKFVIISIKGATSIKEVECSVVTPLHDPSVSFLPPGEYKVEILKPVSLWDKNPDNSFTAPLYFSHSLFDTVEAARAVAERDMKVSYERTCHKCKMEVNGQTLEEMLAKITVQML